RSILTRRRLRGWGGLAEAEPRDFFLEPGDSLAEVGGGLVRLAEGDRGLARPLVDLDDGLADLLGALRLDPHPFGHLIEASAQGVHRDDDLPELVADAADLDPSLADL